MGDRRTWVAWIFASGTIGCIGFASFSGDLREDPLSYAIASLAATLLLYSSVAFYHRRKELAPRRRDILLIALLLRALAFPMSPSLSDDAWRYLWDGRLVANGITPYHHIPADPALIEYRDELYRLQGYPETNTIYPPIAQLIFASAASLDSSPGSNATILYLFYKLLLIAADLAAIWLLLLLLAKLRLSTSGAILYAWHPLVIVELAGQGHTDVFWVLAMGLALCGFVLRWGGAGMPGLAFGVGVRLFPLLVMPIWIRFVEKRKRWTAIFFSLPFFLLLYPLFDSEAFDRYATVATRFTNYYEFNGGIYFTIKGLLDAGAVSPSNTIAGGVTTALMLGGVIAITLWPIKRRTLSALLCRVLAIVTMQIAFSAKVHVWYFVVPLYLLALSPDRRFLWAWLWGALIAPLTYLYYATEPFHERTWVLMLEWGGFALLLAVELFLSRRGERRNETKNARLV